MPKKLMACLFWLISASAVASPWMDPGDARLRHHISVLADAGIISAPISTWPLMWAAVIGDLQQARNNPLSSAEQWSLDYALFHYKQAEQPFKSYTYIGYQSDPSTITHFGTDQREETELKSEVDWLGDHFAFRLRGTWAPDATDDKEVRYDGSYVAALMGNWSINAGAIDRWWGPGWQSSLILSNNARPLNGITFQRNHSRAFDVPVLEWLGPWSLTAFVAQMEKDRVIPDAKLMGMRLSFKPLSALEIGFSRVAQWGGEGRPENIDNLKDLILGNDNVGDDGLTKANEPGNQLGAIDWRLGGQILSTHSAVYMQYVGEDESGGFPSRGFYLFGAESALQNGSIFNRFCLEYADTTVRGGLYNTAYEHSVYQSGYRYYGRAMGASIDNDSRIVSFSASHYFSDGDEINWRIEKLDLNKDSVNRNPGGNVFGDANTKTERLAVSYATVYKQLRISTHVSYLTDDLFLNDQRIEGTSLAIAFEHKLP